MQLLVSGEVQQTASISYLSDYDMSGGYYGSIVKESADSSVLHPAAHACPTSNFGHMP